MLFANGDKVSAADVMATNGVIHVVDTVILPPTSVDMSFQTIVEVAVTAPDNFSTLVTALDAYAANGMSLTTASGSDVAISIDAESGMLMIGDAKVTITDIKTSNGVIHVIDTVILD